MTSDKAASLEQRIATRWAGNAWQTTSLSGGFSGTLKYRLGEDLRHIVLKFHRAGCSGNTNGTTIAHLPAAYRPNNDAEFPGTCDQMDTGTGGSGQSPHFFLSASDGHMEAWGFQAATLASLNVHLPIFDD